MEQVRQNNAQAIKESKAAALALKEYRIWVEQELTDITNQVLELQVIQTKSYASGV